MEKIIINRGNDLDSVYGSDNVEIFITNEKKEKTYHFLINADGYHCVSECYGTTWNWAWNGDFEIKTKKFSDRWKVLLKFPKKQFDIKDVLFFTLIRNRHIDSRWEVSGFPSGGVFFNTERYASIKIK